MTVGVGWFIVRPMDDTNKTIEPIVKMTTAEVGIDLLAKTLPLATSVERGIQAWIANEVHADSPEYFLLPLCDAELRSVFGLFKTLATNAKMNGSYVMGADLERRAALIHGEIVNRAKWAAELDEEFGF